MNSNPPEPVNSDSGKIREKLWDLANLIAGFAVAQNIATTYTVAKSDLDVAMASHGRHAAASIGLILFTACYIYAIRWCHKQGSPHDGSHAAVVWKKVNRGRVIAVLLFAGVTAGTVCGHWSDFNAGKRPQKASVLSK